MASARKRTSLGSWLCTLVLFACGDGDLARPELGDVDAALLDHDASSPVDAAPDSAAPDDAAQPVVDAAGEPDADIEVDASPGLSVSRYDYRFELGLASAESILTLSAPQAGQGCTSLASRLPLHELSADSDTPFTVMQQGSSLSLCGAYQAGQLVTLRALQSVPALTDPSTGVGFSQRLDRSGSLFSYLLGWVEACDLFGPCDAAPSALAHYTISVVHGPDDVVLCAGTRSVAPRRTNCTLLETRAPSYSAFMVASNPGWRSTPLVSAAGVDVVLFEAAHGTLKDALDGPAVGQFLGWLSALLGPFPYGDELRVAGAPVQWLGMEHPANIVLREDLAAIGNLYADVPLHTLLHEIAHQWAGNRVTLASTLDYAWKEAVAEYLVYAFEEQTRPAHEATATRKVWHSTGVGATYPVRPLVEPSVPLWVWSSGAYGSGPMTLFVQLEPYLGRETLLAALVSLLKEPGARSVSDLQHALERESGLSLQTYFNAWVYGRGDVEWPAFHVETQLLGSETQIKLTQTHGTRQRFPCVVELELRALPNVAQRVRVDFGLEPANTTVTVRVPFDLPVSSVRIDPDGRLLDLSLSGQKARSAPSVRFHP